MNRLHISILFISYISLVIITYLSGVFGDVKPDCDCVDWYGRCQDDGTDWIDDDTWSYRCVKPKAQFVGCVATDRGKKQVIRSGSQDTINGFWFKCEESERKLRYEQEPHCNVNGTDYHVGDTYRDGTFQRICLVSGIWVVGCYYKDETNTDQMINVGETANVGVVKHNCQRISDYPGRVQYWTDIRDDIIVAAPRGKGESQIRPKSVTNLLGEPPKPWIHEYAAQFISMDRYDVKIRYLD